LIELYGVPGEGGRKRKEERGKVDRGRKTEGGKEREEERGKSISTKGMSN